MNNIYNSSKIITDTGLMIIRRNPTQYIPDQEYAGQTQLIAEVFDNSGDEISLIGKDGVIEVILFNDVKRMTYQVAIRDNGRGIPIDSLVRNVTSPHTSGKYNTEAYLFSSGQFGNGLKVTTALSYCLRCVTQVAHQGAESIYVKDGEQRDHNYVKLDQSNKHGVVTIFEPSASYFSGVQSYIETGYLGILNRIYRYALFREGRVILRLSDKPFPKKLWREETESFLNSMDDLFNLGTVLFDSSTFDRDTWLLSYLNIKTQPDWNIRVIKELDLSRSSKKDEKELAYDISLFYVTGMTGNNRLGFANSVPIDHPASNHFTHLSKALVDIIAEKIENSNIKQFFLQSYKLPIYMAVDVRYEGAKFVGTTKDAFISVEFRNAYYKSLISQLKGQYAEQIDALYSLLAKDIEERYLASISKTTKAFNPGRIFLNLHNPKAFKDCTRKGDRRDTELFIIEGGSAGNNTEGRDTENHGLFLLRGKPVNPLTEENNRLSDIRVALDNSVYSDLLTILNLDINRPNLDNLYFGKIVLLTDADTHGQHIASIFIGSLFLLCPQLVESGKIYISTPPYYSIRLKGSKHNNCTYLRNSQDIFMWMIENVYYPNLEIFVRPGYQCNLISLSDRQYLDFLKIVLDIGRHYENLQKELVIPEMLIEALVNVLDFLTPDTINCMLIKEKIGADRVYYNVKNNVLIVSIGLDDYSIPLHSFDRALRATIVPLLNRLNWVNRQTLVPNIGIYVKTKNTDYYKEPTQVSLVHLYMLLKNFEKMFEMHHFKGLGGMNFPDVVRTCMGPERTLYQIKEVGDVTRIYSLLGADSTFRKELISLD